MSGSETISSSGVPARLRSMPDHAVEVLVQRLAGVLLEVGPGQADELLFRRVPRPTFMLRPPPETTGSSYWLIW
jgi:hypothetical protein